MHRPIVYLGTFCRGMAAVLWLVPALGNHGLAAQERLPMREAAPNPVPARPLVENLAPARLHQGVYGMGDELDSPLPDELRADPPPGRPGDEWGTQPLLDFLKGNPYRLAFVNGDYVPAPGERLDPDLVQAWQQRQTGLTYGYVMFEGRITSLKRAAIEAMGVRLFDHHTFNCMTAAIPFAALPRLSASSAVRWVGYARPVQRVDRDVAALAADPLRAGDSVTLVVKVFVSDLTTGARVIKEGGATGPVATSRAAWLPNERVLPEGPFQRAFTQDGFEVVDYFDHLRTFVVRGRPSEVARLLAHDFVHFVDLDRRIEPHHDRSMRQIHIDSVRAQPPYDGRDSVVGVMDSGFDVYHADLSGAWYAGWTWNGNNPFTDADGHGSHVLGTIIGRGAGLDPRVLGCAPGTGLTTNRRVYLATAWGGTNGTAVNTVAALTRFGTPITINNVLTPSPSVVNHSWGVTVGSKPVNGYVGTDFLSIAFDDSAFTKRMLHVVSSGNGGGSDYTNQNYRNQNQPAVAKSALVVASAVSHKESDTEYPGRPYFSSSKGPTGDGRYTPQIMAPGRLIRSVAANSGNDHVNFSGTSMAAPHVTGTIAGLHSHYPWMKDEPALTRAEITATANPFEATRNFDQASDSYVYRQGLGMADAYKAHYQSNQPGGFLHGRWYGTITKDTTGVSFDLDIPADASRTFFVLTFDEKPSSESAVRACVHDLDLFLDVAPFSAGYDTGEYSSQRGWDTWEWYGHKASIGEITGRTLRIKIYPRVRPTGSDVVRFGLSYMIPRGDDTPAGTLALSSTEIVKPGATIPLSALVTVPTYQQTNAHVELYAIEGFTLKSMSFQDNGNRNYSYTTSVPADWTMGVLASWFAAQHRRLDWTIQSTGAEGLQTICGRLRADNRASAPIDCISVCVDGKGPNTVTGLHSTSHQLNQWSNDQTIDMRWNPVSDVGCAGVDGFAVRIASSPTAPPAKNVDGNVVTHTPFVIASPGPNYYNIRAIDKAGNLATSTTTWGPFYIDDSDPVLSSVVIANGAALTSNKLVSIALAASDTNSGVDQMRLSGNNASWTAWQTFDATITGYDLTANGGGLADGLKTVFVQVRDKAGNVSATVSDTIQLDSQPPVIDSFKIDNDAPFTSSLSVSLGLQASQSPVQMRFSSDGQTWSPWAAYLAQSNYSLDSYGGSTATGTKRVYAMVRDQALNESAVVSDSIGFYRVPALGSLGTSRFTVVHDQAIDVLGSNLEDVTTVQIGSYLLGKKQDFLAGWFEVKGDKQLVVYPPQLVKPGSYELGVRNLGYESRGTLPIDCLANATSFLACTPAASGRDTIDVILHRGPLPANGLAMLTMSLSGKPLVLPGLVSLEHGGNPVSILDPTFTLLPVLPFDAQGVAHWKLPMPAKLPAATLFFEAVLIDPAYPNRLPFATSNADGTVLSPL